MAPKELQSLPDTYDIYRDFNSRKLRLTLILLSSTYHLPFSDDRCSTLPILLKLTQNSCPLHSCPFLTHRYHYHQLNPPTTCAISNNEVSHHLRSRPLPCVRFIRIGARVWTPGLSLLLPCWSKELPSRQNPVHPQASSR